LALVSQFLGSDQQLGNVLLREYRFGFHESLRVMEHEARGGTRWPWKVPDYSP
jgi:hypothetical protein